MKKKLAYLLTAAAAMVLTTAGVVGAKVSSKEVEPTFATYTNGDASTYYNGISTTATGNTLLTALRTLNLNKRQSTVGYSSMGTTTSGQFKYTDYDPNYVQYDNNGQPYGTRISSFYTYTSATGWNREHVWPNSHGGGSKGSAGSPYPDADIHMPRPTISSENSSRGNSYFVEGMNHSSNGWDPYTAGYSEESRGEAARITFYCMTVNSKLSIAPNNTAPSGTDPITGNSYSSGTTMGNLETLLKWNINYPVTQREKNRNEGAEYLQGNRNAFVDHPEYACRIWGSVNSTTQSLCNSAQWTEADKTAQTYVYSNGSYSTATNEYTISAGDAITFGNYIDGNKVDTGTSWTLYNEDKTSVFSGSSYATSQANNNVKITTSSGVEETFYLKSVYSYTDSNNTAKTAEFWLKIYVSTSSASGTGAPEGSGSMSTEDYILVTSVSEVANGDKVVLTMDHSREEVYGVTGWNNSNDATVSNSNSNWKEFVVESKSTTGFKLKDTTADSYVASPTGNHFKYDSSGGTVSPASDGKFVCNNRYLCKNGTNYRCYTSVGSYIPFYIYKVNTAATKTLSSISVATAPTKTTYSAGESFAPAGLVINRYFSDSTNDTYTYEGHSSEFSFSPNTATALTVSNTSVTISYGGKSCTQAITVNAAQKTLSSITLSGTQTTTFEVGASFTFGGTVTAHYSDNSTADVTALCTYTGYDMSVAGNYTVTVTYNDNVTVKTATYSITVQESGGSGGGGTAESTVSFVAGTDVGSSSGQNEDTITKNGISIYCSSWRNNDSPYRIYSKALVISSTVGDIIGIELNMNGSYYSSLFSLTDGGGSYSSSSSSKGVWTGESSSITLTPSSQARCNSINVTYSDPSAVSKELSYITISGYKSEFAVNSSFSFGGTVTAYYDNETSADVTSSATFTGYNMSSLGSQTVTVTYTEGEVTKSASYSITVAKLNPIQEIYSKSSGASVDVYGYYVGFLDGTGPVIMDGAYGIVVYSKSADVSSYTANETILHVTGSVSIFNGLYEIASPSISVASGSYTAPDTPIVYATKGNETADMASRLTTLTGIPAMASGDFPSSAGSTDITLNFDIGGSSTVKVFYKKAAQTADADAFAAMKSAVNNSTSITIKGFTGWYNGFQVQMNGIIEAAASYTAEQFCSYLLSETDAVCSGWTYGKNNHDALVTVWNKLSSPTDATQKSYPFLPSDQKEVLEDVVANEKGNTMQQAMARYEYLVWRYNLEQFISGRPEITPLGQYSPIASVFSESSLPLTITIIVGVVALSALGGYIFIHKRKES